MEIMRGLCSDAEFMRSIWQRYDALAATDGDASSASGMRGWACILATRIRIFMATAWTASQEGWQWQPVRRCRTLSRRNDRYGSRAKRAKCGNESAVLDKADAPPIPEAYIYLLGMEFLVSLSDGLAGYAIPLYNTLAVQKPPSSSSEPVRAPGPLDPSTLPETEPARVGLVQFVGAMLNAGCPALLAALSFFTTTLSDPLLGDGLTLGLAGGGGGGGPPQPPALSQRNLACLRALVAAAVFLAGTLGPSWFTPQAQAAAAVPRAKRDAAQAECQVGTGQLQLQQQKRQVAHPLLADADPESVQAAMQRLFDASIMLDDSAFHDFVGALCELSFEMVSMQSGGVAEGSLKVEDDNIPSASTSVTSLVTPRSERFGRRGMAPLGGIAALNIQRLVYRSPDVAWDAITPHLLFILRHPVAPQPICLQAARTPSLDDISVFKVAKALVMAKLVFDDSDNARLVLRATYYPSTRAHRLQGVSRRIPVQILERLLDLFLDFQHGADIVDMFTTFMPFYCSLSSFALSFRWQIPRP
ncbi:hypothetical protein BC827DRAFT_1159217 [Russula dissimulans]|nr:hypothetical protein BC827DRAFT_1159217 [Russula dissimulans]